MGDAVVNPAEPEAPAQSFPERLMGVFVSPGETFEDVARKPDFWAPLIAIVIGSVAVFETMLWKIGAERLTRLNIELSGRAGNIPPDQMEQAVSRGAKFTAILYHFLGIVAPPIGLLIMAGIAILIVNVILGARESFKTVFSVVCYADLVSLLGAVMSIALVFFGDPHAAISDGIITGTGIECSVNVRVRITLLKDKVIERPIIAQGGAVHFVGVGPSVEEATEDAARRAVDFTVARTGLSREEAYMLLSIIGELRVGTSPRPVMATRLIVPEEPLRAAGWNGELP